MPFLLKLPGYRTHVIPLALVVLTASAFTGFGAASLAGDPSEHLPKWIKRMTWFGERADWSHDGKRILFLEKTFGDVYEVEVQTGIIRALTHHYPHHGYTRAMYLANGDILLSGAETFDVKNPQANRGRCWLYVLDSKRRKPPVPLGTLCSEGPAVSRKRLHIAWTHVASQYPNEMPEKSSRMLEADIDYSSGTPRLMGERVVLWSTNLPFQCTLETQSFRPPQEQELTFSTYGYNGTEVFGVDLKSGKATNYSQAPTQYDEPEGMFPDGKFTLVECDRQNLKGWQFIDLWKLALDGTGSLRRLTFFSEYPGYKASNGVVSEDGRYVAFQMAKPNEPAGVGHGIFVLDFKKSRD